MKRILPAVLLLLGAWTLSLAEGDTITATDMKGHISTVYNLFDGRNHSIQVIRMSSDGVTEWVQENASGYYDKAYAAAMDPESDLYIAGVRHADGAKYFYLMKYDRAGYLERELAGTDYDCTALKIAADRLGGVAVAGICRFADRNPVLIQKYDSDLSLLWQQEYDGGGRNYIRDLQADYQGHVTVTVETVYGDYRDGSYATRTAVYDRSGGQIELR